MQKQQALSERQAPEDPSAVVLFDESAGMTRYVAMGFFMARPPKEPTVRAADRRELRRWLRAGNTPLQLATRAEIRLEFAEGETAEEIADRLSISRNAGYRRR